MLYLLHLLFHYQLSDYIELSCEYWLYKIVVLHRSWVADDVMTSGTACAILEDGFSMLENGRHMEDFESSSVRLFMRSVLCASQSVLL